MKKYITKIAVLLCALNFMSCVSRDEEETPEAKSITIGTQVWMAKNLDVDHYRNGDPIPQIQNSDDWAALTTGAWCYYGDDSGNGSVYGKLYNWYAVHDSRGLAPKGWHVPSDGEWTTLTNSLGGQAIAGGEMKALSLWLDPNTGADNVSGFSALPGGSRGDDGYSYYDMTINGFWWSDTMNGNTVDEVFYRYLNHNNASVVKASYPKRFGLSVRCVKN